MLGERAVGLRQPQAGLEHGGERALVDGDQRGPSARGRARSRASNRPRSGSSPPTTLVPPPNGTTATPASAHACSTARHLVVVGRRDDRVGRGLAVARALGEQVEVALAAAAQHARLAVVAHVRRPPRSSLQPRRTRRAPARAAARPRAPPAADTTAPSTPSSARRKLGRVSRAATGPRPARPSPRRPARASREHVLEAVERVVELACRPRGAAACRRSATIRAARCVSSSVTRVPPSTASSRASTRRSRSSFSNGVPVELLRPRAAAGRSLRLEPLVGAHGAAARSERRTDVQPSRLTASTRSVRGHQRASRRGSATTLQTASGVGRHGARRARRSLAVVADAARARRSPRAARGRRGTPARRGTRSRRPARRCSRSAPPARAAVPPVASRSSCSSTRAPSASASACISSASTPYSRMYSADTVSCGSLPGLRAGTKPTPSSRAIAAPRMNPRASAATTKSTFRGRAHSASSRHRLRRARPRSSSSGVMSLNRIPGFGKSGMSRMCAPRSVTWRCAAGRARAAGA